MRSDTKDLPEPAAGTEAAGIYVHIPFCVVRCTYCDFYSQVGVDHLEPAYVSALVGDIATFADRSGYRPDVATVFLGGGTPSHIDPAGIGRVLEACRRSFPVAPDAEITVEANPESLTAGRLAEYRRQGVNRLSIGLQSLREDQLRMMGRPHDAAEGLRAVERAVEEGFDNVSVDLIYGLPGQTDGRWREDLRRVATTGVSHVSAYLLETDKDTPMSRELRGGRLQEPEAEEISAQWETTCEVLEGSGFRRYEISNFARPGRECRHNLCYWRDLPFIGFGSSAHGYWEGRRTAVRMGAADYIAAVGRGEETMETIEPPDRDRRLSEAIVTGLRLAEGCDFAWLSRRYGVDLLSRHADLLESEAGRGRLRVEEGRVALTRTGVLQSNDVLCRFV